MWLLTVAPVAPAWSFLLWLLVRWRSRVRCVVCGPCTKDPFVKGLSDTGTPDAQGLLVFSSRALPGPVPRLLPVDSPPLQLPHRLGPFLVGRAWPVSFALCWACA